MRKYFIAFIICGLSLVAILPVNAARNGRVLFISSYSYVWESVPKQIEGIKLALSSSTTLDIEFMDTKRFNDEDSLQRFYQELQYKINRSDPYDVVIVGDDAALHFAIDYRDDLFKNIPIVFEGINDIDYAKKVSQDPLITGIVEQLSYEDNIEFAKKIIPHASSLVAICDDTVTGEGERKQFYTNVDKYSKLNFREINASLLTENEIKKELSSLDQNTILFYLILSENKDQKKYSSEEAAILISENASVPCFRLSEPGIQNGLLGGKVVSFEKMGQTAGKMAQQIINGTNVRDIDPVFESPNIYYINEEVFEKFNINKNLIPSDAVLINHCLSFFEVNEKALLVFSGIAVSLIFVIIAISYNNIKKKKLIKELEKMTVELDYIAKYDDLTGLANRRHFINDLDLLIDQETELSLIFLGLDNFKRINDVIGNEMGNIILRQLGELFKKEENDRVYFYRLSGDEFAIIFKDNDANHVDIFISSLLEKMKTAFTYNHHEYNLTCSMGISMYPQDAKKVKELMAYADAAMTTVKKNGKNDYRYYDKIIEKQRLDALKIENILTDILSQDGFKMVYQPLVDSQSGDIVSFEALIRFKDGLLRPDQFIPVAEECGLIIPISRWVIKKVISDLAVLKEFRKELKPISINFSSIQLRDEGLIDYIEDLLDEYDIEGKYIEFEITERVLIRMNKEVERFFSQLNKLGIHLVLDDFGTGYASIEYLLDIPFSKVKLDKSMVYKFLDIRNGEVMDTLIQLIHGLNYKVVAEGVETKEQFQLLQDAQCDYIQGYYFEKPIDFPMMNDIYDINYFKELKH